MRGGGCQGAGAGWGGWMGGGRETVKSKAKTPLK